LDIIKDIKNHSEITIYDNSIKEDTFMGLKVERDLQKFLESNQLIIANRFEKDLENHREKVFTRDIFNYL
jgi:UDPglucose 6-dehydrogenase